MYSLYCYSNDLHAQGGCWVGKRCLGHSAEEGWRRSSHSYPDVPLPSFIVSSRNVKSFHGSFSQQSYPTHIEGYIFAAQCTCLHGKIHNCYISFFLCTLCYLSLSSTISISSKELKLRRMSVNVLGYCKRRGLPKSEEKPALYHLS